MKKILPISIVAIFSVAPVFADNITAASTCTNGVLGTYTGPANIEANFDPNTINTTWYSNGTQLTGNNIPATCTYDAALTPPTPADRPGYVFGGWTLKPPACEIPSSLVATGFSSYGFKNDSTGQQGAYSQNTSDYGLTEDNTWGVTWSNGDKMIGEARCSALRGNNHSYGWGGNSADWAASESDLTSASGGTYNCWCKPTGYIASGVEQCSLSSSLWVFSSQIDDINECKYLCALNCEANFRANASFRAAVVAEVLAQ